MLEVGTGFHPEMTGRENVYLNGAILGMTRAEIDAKMAEIIEFSEVGDFIDTPVKRYSSGMFVKLAFSVAAHLDSEIMIMDEVLAVGDMKFQKKCLTKMRQAARRDGKTVLYVSHNMATIRDLCDRCIVLDKGKVIFDGDVDEGIALYLSTKSQLLILLIIPISSAITGLNVTIYVCRACGYWCRPSRPLNVPSLCGYTALSRRRNRWNVLDCGLRCVTRWEIRWQRPVCMI